MPYLSCIEITFKTQWWTHILLPYTNNIHGCYLHMERAQISMQDILSLCCIDSRCSIIIVNDVNNIVQDVRFLVSDIERERCTPRELYRSRELINGLDICHISGRR